MDTPTPQHFPHFDSARVETALAAAAAAFRLWRERPFPERSALLNGVAGHLETRQEELARLITSEMGKPIAAARAEVAKCATVCRYYAENGAAFLAGQTVNGPAPVNRLRYEPLGPVLAVMPWNFPFWQVFRFAAPALMAGNVALLKHSSNVPGCAMAIESLFGDFPEGVFQTLLIPASGVEAVIGDRRVAAVTLTGSVEAGRKVAAQAGAALKKTVLELGGSDPFIILPDADLDRAIPAAVQARTVNSGQSCIAAKRFLIHEAVYDEVERRFVAAMEALVVGDPFEEKTAIGPLATPAIAEEVHAQVEASVAAGARLLTGGRRLRGSFYAPTVLADLPPDAPAYREEVFGPVALLYRVRDLEHALEIANASDFGLGAAVWTRNRQEAEEAAARLENGVVFVNGIVASDPRIPFGGVKHSGYGRELGAAGIREFVNLKSVCIAGMG